MRRIFYAQKGKTMATINQWLRNEYKFCAMNGVPLKTTVRGSLEYDTESMTFTVEQAVLNDDGNPMIIDFSGAFGGESSPELITEKLTRPIIALPHEFKAHK